MTKILAVSIGPAAKHNFFTIGPALPVLPYIAHWTSELRQKIKVEKSKPGFGPLLWLEFASSITAVPAAQLGPILRKWK